MRNPLLFSTKLIIRICFRWKLGLVAVCLIPIIVMAGYLRFSLLNKLNDQLRNAYENSAQLACEQVAAMRTVASLNREIALHEEFVQSLKAPVRRAMYSTLKSTAVLFHFLNRVDSSYLHWDKVLRFLRMP